MVGRLPAYGSSSVLLARVSVPWALASCLPCDHSLAELSLLPSVLFFYEAFPFHPSPSRAPGFPRLTAGPRHTFSRNSSLLTRSRIYRFSKFLFSSLLTLVFLL